MVLVKKINNHGNLRREKELLGRRNRGRDGKLRWRTLLKAEKTNDPKKSLDGSKDNNQPIKDPPSKPESWRPGSCQVGNKGLHVNNVYPSNVQRQNRGKLAEAESALKSIKGDGSRSHIGRKSSCGKENAAQLAQEKGGRKGSLREQEQAGGSVFKALDKFKRISYGLAGENT